MYIHWYKVSLGNRDHAVICKAYLLSHLHHLTFHASNIYKQTGPTNYLVVTFTNWTWPQPNLTDYRTWTANDTTNTGAYWHNFEKYYETFCDNYQVLWYWVSWRFHLKSLKQIIFLGSFFMIISRQIHFRKRALATEKLDDLQYEIHFHSRIIYRYVGLTLQKLGN